MTSTTLVTARIINPPATFGVAPDASDAQVNTGLGALLVVDGRIAAAGTPAELAAHPLAVGAERLALTEGLLLPGFVDTHVHFPQMRAIGSLGMPLLDWLQECALPEEVKLADPTYAGVIAREFVSALAHAGTTTALVFGSHFAEAMEALFVEAEQVGLRITSGQVVSDRMLRPELHSTPEDAWAQGVELIERWHGRGRLRYAVTPRFALSASSDLRERCAQLMDVAPDIWFTTHINENLAEVLTVAELEPKSAHYLDTYDDHGLVTPRSVFAHNVHPTAPELEILGQRRAWVAHCPSSNAVLGSGTFDFQAHLRHGVGVALGTDVGAGTGFSMMKEALQAHLMQRLLPEGVNLPPGRLLYLATVAGAQALGMENEVGRLVPGMAFDAVWVRPEAGTPLEVNLRHARDETEALAKILAMGTSADIAGVWVGGAQIVR